MQTENKTDTQNLSTEALSASTSQKQSDKDSLGLDVKKSPWLLFALLQIPIVIGMIILIYFMYQNANVVAR
jgi:hypothetical protein